MQPSLSDEPFRIVELDVDRAGDVNRHRYRAADIRSLVQRVRPALVDIHEEPFSVATRQWLREVSGVPAVAYTAQNVDKRFPPPFAQMERAAHRRLTGVYACSRQAASVTRGKGFSGQLEVLPLGLDDSLGSAGTQELDDATLTLGLVGRLVPEKGVLDAVRVLAHLHRLRPTRLLIVGEGPERAPAETLAGDLGVGQQLSVLPWQGGEAMAALYREMHVVLVPSVSTGTWTEQFGRVIVEAQAAGAVVVAYASGAIPEVLGSAGTSVREGDVQALAERVAETVADPKTWSRMRREGLRQAAGLTWKHVAEAQLAFYSRVMAGSTPAVAVGRQAAVAEFGETARLAGGVARPFALPVLRRDVMASRVLGRAIDLGQALRRPPV